MPWRKKPTDPIDEFVEWQEHRYDGVRLSQHWGSPSFFLGKHPRAWARFLLVCGALCLAITVWAVLRLVQAEGWSGTAVGIIASLGTIGLLLVTGGAWWLAIQRRKGARCR